MGPLDERASGESGSLSAVADRDSDLRRLARGTGQQVAARMVTAGATFAALALAARALDTPGFGVLTFYLLLWAILEVFLDMGSMSAALRIAAADPRAEGAALARMVALRAILLAPCWLAVAACVVVFAEEQAGWILLASTALGAHLLTPRTATLHRTLTLHPIARARGTGALAALAIVAVMVCAGIDAPGPLLCAFGLGTVTTAWLSWRAAPRPAPSALTLPWHTYLAEAIPLGLGALARVLYFWMDGLLVRVFCGEQEVGLYNSAYRIFNLSILVASYASSTALPIFARAFAQDPARAARLARRLLGVLAAIGLPLAGAMALLAGPLLGAAFGPSYAQAAPVLATLAGASAAIYLAALLLTVLTAQRAARAVATISALALVLNALLNLLWIPAGGALGAARATACTEALVLVLAAALSWRGLRRRAQSSP